MTGALVEESLSSEFVFDESVSKVGEVLGRIDEWVSVVGRKFDRVKRFLQSKPRHVWLRCFLIVERGCTLRTAANKTKAKSLNWQISSQFIHLFVGKCSLPAYQSKRE